MPPGYHLTNVIQQLVVNNLSLKNQILQMQQFQMHNSGSGSVSPMNTPPIVSPNMSLKSPFIYPLPVSNNNSNNSLASNNNIVNSTSNNSISSLAYINTPSMIFGNMINNNNNNAASNQFFNNSPNLGSVNQQPNNNYLNLLNSPLYGGAGVNSTSNPNSNNSIISQHSFSNLYPYNIQGGQQQ